MLQTIVTFFTQSSEDPTKTSATLTGILLALSAWASQYLAFIPFIHDFYASPAGQQVEPICTSLGMAIGGIWALFGLFRKITNKVETNVTTG